MVWVMTLLYLIKEKSLFLLTKEQIIKISDRNNIGCDQVIFIDKDKRSNILS